jgi:hypothetical protein
MKPVISNIIKTSFIAVMLLSFSVSAFGLTFDISSDFNSVIISDTATKSAVAHMQNTHAHCADIKGSQHCNSCVHCVITSSQSQMKAPSFSKEECDKKITHTEKTIENPYKPPWA